MRRAGLTGERDGKDVCRVRETEKERGERDGGRDERVVLLGGCGNFTTIFRFQRCKIKISAVDNRAELQKTAKKCSAEKCGNFGETGSFPANQGSSPNAVFSGSVLY